MKWLIAADDFAKNSNPPFACGIPDFTQQGDRFGVIVLTDALVDVVSAGTVFNSFRPFSHFQELTMLWRNSTGFTFIGPHQYVAGFPLFMPQGSSWICDRVALVKDLPDVTMRSAGIYSFQTDLEERREPSSTPTTTASARRGLRGPLRLVRLADHTLEDPQLPRSADLC